MASEFTCVFCGETPSGFRREVIRVGNTTQWCCKSCNKAAADLSDEELCREVLRLGFAQEPEKVEAHLEFIAEAKQARPKCLRCGTPLKFRKIVYLDRTPFSNSILSNTFDLLPAGCPNCHKIEFYSPDLMEQDEKFLYLYQQDTD